LDSPWEKEEILETENVFRQIHFSVFPKGEKKRFPKESHFTSEPDGLSVNWEKHCGLNESFIIIGLSYKPNTTVYKNPADYKAFKFNVAVLKKIEGINDVIHDPMYYGNPAPLGKPNNRGHALVKYPNDEEIRVNLCDLVGNNYDKINCKPDIKLIEQEIIKLRDRLE